MPAHIDLVTGRNRYAMRGGNSASPASASSLLTTLLVALGEIDGHSHLALLLGRQPP